MNQEQTERLMAENELLRSAVRLIKDRATSSLNTRSTDIGDWIDDLIIIEAQSLAALKEPK